MMAEIKEATLAEIVTQNFRAAAIFEKFGLDFCCRGKRSIEEACKEKKINSDAVVYEIEKILLNEPYESEKFHLWSSSFLIDYILNNHHKYVKNAIPVILQHTRKVASVHGELHPEVVEVAKLFEIVSEGMTQHMKKEEEILFPFIKQLEKTGSTDKPGFGSVLNPIRMMEAEHQEAGDEMEAIKQLTNNFNPPEDACNTYKVSYQELKEFYNDLHKHVHLENNILFPQAMVLENQIVSS